ncbi:MAG TPA: M1 family metallopeptidase [Pyrinomonadaceae bacterium]|nr:M1 family metallopeptidase [Pyrinomonadaceae bacterium]
MLKPEINARRVLRLLVVALLFALSADAVRAQRELGVRPTDSGGPLMPEQAAYDVKSYDLALRLNLEAQSINGELTVKAQIVHPIAWLVLDLDTPLKVLAVFDVEQATRPRPLQFERRGGKIWIAFPMTKQPGANISVRVHYEGKPRVAPRPPWVGGFIWTKTPSGAPWVAVACQNDGADLWWPCKDHPSDEADTFSLHITVPEPLVVAANGHLQSVVKNSNGTQTFNWQVSNPINNYDVSINVAPYRTVEGQFKSVAGENVPVFFYALPENYEKAQVLFTQFMDYLNFLESLLGPYPFRSDKIGVAETPYLGMEHQTITAYGNQYKNNAYGFDGLLFHEIGHEWWGNLVTASDWRDMWLHEGFQSYMDALYAGRLKGDAGYNQYLAGIRGGIGNFQAVAPRETRSTTQIYFREPDYVNSDGDIYSKGAWILHTLRYLIGDKAFFTALRRMAYPDPAMEKMKDGRQTRFATTDDFRRIAEEASGMELDWFFEVYLRQPKLPRLVQETSGNNVLLRWEVPNNLPFPMPVDVDWGGTTAPQRVEMKDGSATITLKGGQVPTLDRNKRILKAE